VHHGDSGRFSFLFIFMPNTGRFFIDQVEGVLRADGLLLQVTRVSCACLQCGRQLRLVPGHGLLDLDGAAVLTCPLCGNRQAVARARLEELCPPTSPPAPGEP
jgi:hypothetical protein